MTQPRIADLEDNAPAERFERLTELPLGVLAILFLAAYAWPILDPQIPDGWKLTCQIVNYAVWAIFGIDFIVRLILAADRLRYAARHTPDLLMLALPVLRPLRVLRLVVLLHMLNRRATSTLRGKVALYVGSSALLVWFSASLAVLDAERAHVNANIHTFGDATWWAATTMTTVGYGDRYPTSAQGRAVGFALMLAGIAILGMVTASIASWLIDRVREIDTQSQAATRGDIHALQREIAQLRRQLADAAEPVTESSSQP